VVSARFEVYRNPGGSRSHPLLVVVQHPHLERLPTRVVIPLVRREALQGLPISRLNPSYVLERLELVLLTQQLGAVRAAGLRKRVGSLAEHAAEILAAIDLLLSGV
jgi:toxin CcdB